MALGRYRNVREAGLDKENGADEQQVPEAFMRDDVNYDDFSPSELARLRACGGNGEGEKRYQQLREAWIAAGQPRGAKHGSLLATGERYEDFTAGEMAQLRNSGAEGETRYTVLRKDWVARGCPNIKFSSGGDAA